MDEIPLVNMARLELYVLAIFAFTITGSIAGLSSILKDTLSTVSDVLSELTCDDLFQNVQQPTTSTNVKEAASSGNIEQNVTEYCNKTVATNYADILKNKTNLPRGVPFSVNEPTHISEAKIIFKVLYSAKTLETFWKIAAWLRNTINEEIFVYVISIVITYRKDTQNITIPALYETIPDLFNYGSVIATANRINVHGSEFLKYYPSTYKNNDSIVIKENSHKWHCAGDKNYDLSYFLNDDDLNNCNYLHSVSSPYWLGGSSEPSVSNKKSRGEDYFFYIRQLLNAYNLQRLSNGKGEIPELTNVFEDGCSPGLLHSCGVPFTSRQDYFRLDQSEVCNAVEEAKEYENRIKEAIHKGYYINSKGENVCLRNETGLETLGSLIECNADSSNRDYYKDFISIWKKILGNSIKSGYQYVSNCSNTPLVVTSALENDATACRDTAYYSILKRVLNLFEYWQKLMPEYKDEDLSVPVEIASVNISKLTTFFEYKRRNITNKLYKTKKSNSTCQCEGKSQNITVLVEKRRLSYENFNISLCITSESARNVTIKFFIGPKYNSKGVEINIPSVTQKLFLIEKLSYSLCAGENNITCNSSDFKYNSKSFYPSNLILPKGQVGGQTFRFFVYIQDANNTRNCAFPTDRPLDCKQIKGLKNLLFKDVKIYHEER